MKTIFRIARMELQKMFYSPIAWLILLAFAVQSGITMASLIEGAIITRETGFGGLKALTSALYRDNGSLFMNILGYLYLYIPLLSMGLLSTEFSSGSIKLLYSSPVSNKQIVFGKFVSMMAIALVFISLLFLAVILGFFTIDNFDFPSILTALLGMYLLMCTYAAIGLFMSSLTSYQMVAALGTFVTFFFLSRVGSMWQDIEFVRDITYWLSLNERAQTFIKGMICSEDLLYFILVSGLFIAFTIFRLKGVREKTPKYVSFTRYAGAFLVVALLGYVSTNPYLMKYYDATFTKSNTLAEHSQEVISKLNGKVTVTTYVNLFDKNYGLGAPVKQKSDMSRYDKYRRFYPNMKFKYKYYYAPPISKTDDKISKAFDVKYKGLTQEEIRDKLCENWEVNPKKFKPGRDYLDEIDLESEENRFVCKITTEDGKSSYLRVFDDGWRYPHEAEITAAFKHLVDELPLAGFVTGHEERAMNSFADRGYARISVEKPFRNALINNGYDLTECELSEAVDQEIDILVIAGSKTAFSEKEMKNLDDYIDRGGNLVIAADLKRQEAMNPLVERFGVKFLPGQVAEHNEDFGKDLVTAEVSPQGESLNNQFALIGRQRVWGAVITMPGTVAISYQEQDGVNYIPTLVSDAIKNGSEASDKGNLKKDDSQKDMSGLGKGESRMLKMLRDKAEKNRKGSWNELQTTDFIDDTPVFNPEKGEIAGPLTTGLAVSRRTANKEQRVMIFGDADCLSNDGVNRFRIGVEAQNFGMALGMFRWLSYDEAPVPINRPSWIDNAISLETEDVPFIKALYKIVIPALLGLAFLLTWLRRKSR